jgi:hypothetical protein
MMLSVVADDVSAEACRPAEENHRELQSLLISFSSLRQLLRFFLLTSFTSLSFATCFPPS